MRPTRVGEWPSPDSDGGGVAVEDTYRSQATFLRDVAERKFRIPPTDAEALVNEVFMSYLIRQELIRNPRKWLIGAVCHASRTYWRSEAKTKPLPPNIGDYPDPESPDEARIVDRVTVAATLNRLCVRCRETLRLYYAEGYSAAEIAKHFGTTTGYAMQLLHSCRKRARTVYQDMTAKEPTR